MITISGTVEEGVEAGCSLLQNYLLITNDPDDRAAVAPGQQVEVTGYVDQSILSYCQQGTPLVVTSVRPIAAGG